MNESNLQRHPEIQRLADENALLREELIRLLTEAEDLVHIIKPNLLALYQTKIGGWELRALQAQFVVARLRRQIELAQASLNRGARPDPIAIEGALELEFLAWQTKLKEAAERIQAAETRLKHLLSPPDDRELKKLYYALVKRLHPDVNPNLTDDQRRLWLRVQSAYEAGDLPELRALALLAEKSAAVPLPKSLDNLRQDQKILETQIAVALKHVEQIESQPPFTLRRQLEDETWLATRRQEIEQQTAALREQGDALKAHWEKLWELPDMEQSLVKIDPVLLALMHGSFGQDGALKPFAREIMLIECHIAGTSHRDVKTVEPQLLPGALLPLKREPDNPHDPLAIMIFNEAGHHLGYVPRAKNEALARLMDAGKLLFGKLESKSWQGDWLKVAAHIYLRDF